MKRRYRSMLWMPQINTALLSSAILMEVFSIMLLLHNHLPQRPGLPYSYLSMAQEWKPLARHVPINPKIGVPWWQQQTVGRADSTGKIGEDWMHWKSWSWQRINSSPISNVFI